MSVVEMLPPYCYNVLEKTAAIGRDAMQNRKISVRWAYILGQAIVNGGVLLIMFGTWIFSFVLVIKANLSIWFILIGVFAGPLFAWIWWSFSLPRWRHWARLNLHEEDAEKLHQLSVSGQLEWPRGHVLGRTEFKSREHTLQDLKSAVQAMEKYSYGKTTRYIEEHKASYPGYDTGIIDDVKGFIVDLKATLADTDFISGIPEMMPVLDELLNRITRTTNTLNEFHWSEYSEWHFIAQADLTQTRTVLLQLMEPKGRYDN